jgi:hypothetical protein
MKIRRGQYVEQTSFGITYAYYHDRYKALIFEFGIWYVELIFKDYEKKN